MASYLAAKGSRLTNNDAAILGRHFEELARLGPVTPTEIVNAARPSDSLTHRYFEWDNEMAAEAYRLDQARHYLRSIEVVVTPAEETVRAFHVVTITEGEKRGYLNIDTIRSEPALMSQVVETARRELVNWEHRYRQYAAMKSSVALVGEAIQQLSLPEAATGRQ